MTSALNRCALKLQKRAENVDLENLIHTFVEVGPVVDLLSVKDNQIVYGRRGTGKTHLFNFIADTKIRAGDCVVLEDLRNIGSNGGIYADRHVSIAERGTRLLVDVLHAIYESVAKFFIDNSEELDLSATSPSLDRLAAAITEVKITGETSTASQHTSTEAKGSASEINLGVSSASDFNANVKLTDETRNARTTQSSRGQVGRETLYVNFEHTSSAFKEIIDRLDGKRLWILLDEWSSVPNELQPYLADLLRRCLFPLRGITIKIAAIEHRTSFIIWGRHNSYTGIEVGADAAADINLDDFMVFDNDPEKSKKFFRSLIAKHIQSVAKAEGLSASIPTTEAQIISALFTEKRAVEEFVRACEGVPRDAINIISLAARRAIDDAISVKHVRVAADNWYSRDKGKAVAANEDATRLLRWITDKVIGERKARAFLLQTDAHNELVDSLYDSRVLHILKRGISSHDAPGIRYDVYKIDYGCYVDLMNTSRAPGGDIVDELAGSQDVEVPVDDYRSIRRAVLDLSKFNEGA